MDFRELSGRAAGVLLAPLTGAIALVRHARTFHPDGTLFRARVEPLVTEGAAARLAERLSGEALVRLSSAWWRGEKEWMDVLGCAVRFLGESAAHTTQPSARDQDLLTATIRSPLTMALAPLTTLQHDFLANDYYAVSPFEVEGLGRAKLRLHAVRHERHAPGPGDEGHSRLHKLSRAVKSGEAVFRLEFLQLPPVRGLRSLLRSALLGTSLDRSGVWVPLAEVRLIAPSPLDGQTMRFSPFLAGRGLRPSGFVHALRAATYAISQAARPARRAARPAH